MKANLITQEIAKASNIDLILNGKGTQAVHDVIVALRANRRSGTASVKTKATVNLSGRKPWRQKGTGRARAGYFSSPVWVGGGVAHGPHPRSYAKNITKGVKRLALKKALSARILAGDVFSVEKFEVTQPKTKEFVSFLTSLIGESKSTLVISSSFSKETFLSARNIQHVLLMSAAEVNTENLLAFDKIIITQEALVTLGQRLV